MDWSQHSIPAMRLEARFGDRLVPAFCERPGDIWAMIADAAARNPDGEALICGDAADELARGRAAIGADCGGICSGSDLQRGDRVAVLLGNRIEFVLTMFAAAHAGLVTVLLSTRQQKPEIAYVLTDCGAKLLIHEATLPTACPMRATCLICCIGFPSMTMRRVAIRRARWIMPPSPAPAEVGEEDTAMILYTSGTTGKPKGAMLAHCNVIHSAMVFVSCMQLTSADRSIAAVPLGHVTGVVANIMTMVRCAGALIIMPEFKAAEYLKLAARERVTYTVMVPAMYNLCLLQPDFDSYDLSSWRIGGFGGAPMPIATIERLDAKIPGLKLMNCYGATETTSPSTIMPGELTAEHIDSVGLPCPGAQIIVVDADGHELPRGEIGEIWIHGGSVIKGYWNNPKATAESFTAGFWHSGDLGSIDEENFVRVFDRQKDMINRGGLKIYSAEVEVGAGRPSRRGRERDHRKALPGAGRARPCRRGDRGTRSASRPCAPGAPSGCRTTRCRRPWISPPSRCRATPMARCMKRQLARGVCVQAHVVILHGRSYSFGALPFGIGLRSLCSAASASRRSRPR